MSETLFSVATNCSVAKPGAKSNTLAKYFAMLKHLHTPKYQTVPQWWKMEQNAKTSMRAIRCFVFLVLSCERVLLQN